MIGKIVAKLRFSRTLKLLAPLPQEQQLLQQIALQLKKPDWLKREVAIYVPTTVDVDVPADNSLYAKQTWQLMKQWFGNATQNEQDGTYMSKARKILPEKSIVVSSNTTSPVLDRHFLTLVGFVGELQYELRQESMAIELDDAMLLLEFACD